MKMFFAIAIASFISIAAAKAQTTTYTADSKMTSQSPTDEFGNTRKVVTLRLPAGRPDTGTYDSEGNLISAEIVHSSNIHTTLLVDRQATTTYAADSQVTSRSLTDEFGNPRKDTSDK